MNPPSVQKLLGHLDLTTTEYYAHAVDRDLLTALEDMEALVMKAPVTTRRQTLQPSGTDVKRSAESERRPIRSSRGAIDRDLESERRHPTLGRRFLRGRLKIQRSPFPLLAHLACGLVSLVPAGPALGGTRRLRTGRRTGRSLRRGRGLRDQSARLAWIRRKMTGENFLDDIRSGDRNPRMSRPKGL